MRSRPSTRSRPAFRPVVACVLALVVPAAAAQNEPTRPAPPGSIPIELPTPPAASESSRSGPPAPPPIVVRRAPVQRVEAAASDDLAWVLPGLVLAALAGFALGTALMAMIGSGVRRRLRRELERSASARVKDASALLDRLAAAQDERAGRDAVREAEQLRQLHASVRQSVRDALDGSPPGSFLPPASIPVDPSRWED